MLKRFSVLAVLMLASALAVAGCGGGSDDSSDSTASGDLYGGTACKEELTSSDCIAEVEEKTGGLVEEGEEAVDQEQAEDQEEFENEEGVYGSGEEYEEEEYGDPSETVKPPSEK